MYASVGDAVSGNSFNSVRVLRSTIPMCEWKGASCCIIRFPNAKRTMRAECVQHDGVGIFWCSAESKQVVDYCCWEMRFEILFLHSNKQKQRSKLILHFFFRLITFELNKSLVAFEITSSWWKSELMKNYRKHQTIVSLFTLSFPLIGRNPLNNDLRPSLFAYFYFPLNLSYPNWCLPLHLQKTQTNKKLNFL